MVLVIFQRFLNFGPFFGPFLGTVVENSKHKRVVPGNSVKKKLKILTLIFGSQKCVFPKRTFSRPQWSRRGLVWCLLNSRGLDNRRSVVLSQNSEDRLKGPKAGTLACASHRPFYMLLLITEEDWCMFRFLISPIQLRSL